MKLSGWAIDDIVIWNSIYMLTVSLFVHLCTASDSNNVTCTRWPNVKVTSGSTWRERCRRCQCTSDGRTDCSEPICTLAYHPYQEDRCEQWSSDACCCERLVCRHNGKVYNIGEKFPLHDDGPCKLCTCRPEPGMMECVSVDCGVVECVDPVVTVGHCCHTCPHGPNCRLPPLDWPDNSEAVTISPVPFNQTRIIFSNADSRLAWSCTCKMAGSDAMCSRQARLFHMGFTRYTN